MYTSYLLFVLLFIGILSLTAALHYVDARYNLRLVAWMNGETNNPFSAKSIQDNSHVPSAEKDKDELIERLQARVEVLEKVVTEPAYELNKKINQL